MGFTTFKDGEVEIKPSSIRWAVTGQKEQIAARNRDREHWKKVKNTSRLKSQQIPSTKK